MSANGSRRFRHSLTAAVSIVVIVLMGACGTADSSRSSGAGGQITPTDAPNELNIQPTALATKGPEPSPMPISTQDPNAGFSLAISGTYINPSSAEEFVQWCDMIVSGTVIQILPAQWSTADGSRPADVSSKTVPDKYTIVTPAILELDGAPLVNRLAADGVSGQMVVTTFGGQVGKDYMITEDPTQHLQVGQHVLLGLSDHAYPQAANQGRYQTTAGQSWTVVMVYTLTNDGKAVPVRYGDQSYDQPVDAQAFMAAIVAESLKNP